MSICKASDHEASMNPNNLEILEGGRQRQDDDGRARPQNSLAASTLQQPDLETA